MCWRTKLHVVVYNESLHASCAFPLGIRSWVFFYGLCKRPKTQCISNKKIVDRLFGLNIYLDLSILDDYLTEQRFLILTSLNSMFTLFLDYLPRSVHGSVFVEPGSGYVVPFFSTTSVISFWCSVVPGVSCSLISISLFSQEFFFITYIGLSFIQQSFRLQAHLSLSFSHNIQFNLNPFLNTQYFSLSFVPHS